MNLEIAPVFKPLFAKNRARYYVSDGGRGGGRSWTFARALILRGAMQKERILCARQYQNSIKDSSHRLLADQIETLGLGSFYTITRDSIVGVNGTNFLFKGLHHNIADIKSTEGVTICWVEEAEKVSEESWNVLLPTIRTAGSEIWITFNPYKESDPTYQRFIVNPPPSTVRMRAGYAENPWFPPELRALMEHDRETNPDRYQWIWEGKCLGISEAQVFKGKYSIQEIEYTGKEEFMFGADWGFASDPTALIRCFIRDGNLYIDQEAYGAHVEIVDLPVMFERVERSKISTIYADLARPEIISHLKNHGYPYIKKADKWPGCVEDGISYLKGYKKIIISPACKNTIEEFELYQYKQNKQTNEILPELVDKNNHAIDAIRYAHHGLIKRRGANVPTQNIRGSFGI